MDAKRGAPASIRSATGAAPSGLARNSLATLRAAAESAVVQEESFGPLLVVERAAGFEEALDLANGVRQGLVAALFAGPGPWRDRFREAAQAGILKWNASTADADAAAPFGGWKASGIGPPERGSGDLEFFSRAQALYGGL